MKTILTTLILCALSHGLTAQNSPPISPGKIGFSVSGAQGSAGTFCSGFQCAALSMNITRGEKLTLSIRTQMQSTWILVVGAPSKICVPIPGIGNLWAGPSIVIALGRVTNLDRIRCWGGLQTLSIPVPKNVPLKTSGMFQVVTDVVLANNTVGPVFSSPVQVTVTQ